MKFTKFIAALLVGAVTFSSCDKDNDNDYENKPSVILSNVVKSSGDVNASLAQFRSLIGDSLNSTPGKTTGRREINWDGVPAAAHNPFPATFFNDTSANGANGRKRGLVYVNNVTFRVDSTDFSNIDPSYAAQFDAFSGKRVFSSAGSPVSEVRFKVAGTNTDAFVKGFGVVFVDVDDANSTSLEFFNDSKSLGVFKAPVKTTSSPFSFLGVQFPHEKVTSVKITAGNNALAAGVKDLSDGGTKDVVVMDDFFYSEPNSLQ